MSCTHSRMWRHTRELVHLATKTVKCQTLHTVERPWPHAFRPLDCISSCESLRIILRTMTMAVACTWPKYLGVVTAAMATSATCKLPMQVVRRFANMPVIISCITSHQKERCACSAFQRRDCTCAQSNGTCDVGRLLGRCYLALT